jgi:hypothetical protein
VSVNFIKNYDGGRPSVNDWMVAMIGCNSMELVCNSVKHIETHVSI